MSSYVPQTRRNASRVVTFSDPVVSRRDDGRVISSAARASRVAEEADAVSPPSVLEIVREDQSRGRHEKCDTRFTDASLGSVRTGKMCSSLRDEASRTPIEATAKIGDFRNASFPCVTSTISDPPSSLTTCCSLCVTIRCAGVPICCSGLWQTIYPEHSNHFIGIFDELAFVTPDVLRERSPLFCFTTSTFVRFTSPSATATHRRRRRDAKRAEGNRKLHSSSQLRRPAQPHPLDAMTRTFESEGLNAENAENGSPRLPRPPSPTLSSLSTALPAEKSKNVLCLSEASGKHLADVGEFTDTSWTQRMREKMKKPPSESSSLSSLSDRKERKRRVKRPPSPSLKSTRSAKYASSRQARTLAISSRPLSHKSYAVSAVSAVSVVSSVPSSRLRS